MGNKLTIVKAIEEKDGVKLKIRNGDKIIITSVPFTNYFYIQSEDYDFLTDTIEQSAKTVEYVNDRDGKEFVKIYLKNNFYRVFLRNKIEDYGVKTFEADIPSAKRMLIDNPDLQLNQGGLVKGFYDCESRDDLPLKKDKIGNILPTNEILSIAIKEYNKNKNTPIWYDYNKGLDDSKFDSYKKLREDFLDLKIKKKELDNTLNDKLKPLREITKPFRLKISDLEGEFEKINKKKKNTKKELERLPILKEELKILNEELKIKNIETEEIKNLKNEILKYNNKIKECNNLIQNNEQEVSIALLEGEKELLQRFLLYANNKFDLLSGWHSSGFDDIMVRGRSKYHKLSFDFDDLMTTNMDYLLIFKKDSYDPVDSYNLNNVAYTQLKSELGKENSKLKSPEEITKIDWKKKTKAKKFFELFLLYPKLHEDYNKQDDLLLEMLEDKFSFFTIHELQSELEHCFMLNTLFNSNICDIAFLSEARNRNIIKISSPTREEAKRRETINLPGGYTYLFKPGYHENVVCFDYSSHYPHVIKTHNISQDTYLRTVIPDLSKVFNEREIQFIIFCRDEAHKFWDNKQKVKKKAYEKYIEEQRQLLDVEPMEKLMWRFILKYDQKIEHTEDETFTPSEINYNAYGWDLQFHQVFTKKELGIIPSKISKYTEMRSKIKKEMKELEKQGLKESFEYQSLFAKQLSIKIIINSFYGFTGYRLGRDFMKELPIAITTTCRYLTKKCMIEGFKMGLDITHGDTDSCYYLGVTDIEESNKGFKKCIDEIYNNNFNTITYENGVNHFVNFEYETTYPAMIPVKKKRYYYLTEDGKVDGKGGSLTRKDVLPSAKALQKELLEDIFFKKLDLEHWKDKILKLKEKVFNYELEEKEIMKVYGIGRDLDTYGQEVIDSRTKLQKKTKDDKPMFAPIPAGIQIARRLQEQGELIMVGDKINFIVKEKSPKIIPMTMEEYRNNPTYDKKYYFECLVKPILEILLVTYKKETFTLMRDCWYYSDRQLQNIDKKLQEEDLDDDE